jgi:hypothetical protein
VQRAPSAMAARRNGGMVMNAILPGETALMAAREQDTLFCGNLLDGPVDHHLD